MTKYKLTARCSFIPQFVGIKPGQTILVRKVMYMCTQCLLRYPRFIDVRYLPLMSIVKSCMWRVLIIKYLYDVFMGKNIAGFPCTLN